MIVIRNNLTAVSIKTSPKIDGILDDEVWKTAPIATDFIQNSPNPGKASAQKTEVKVLYTDYALYIGATMYDVSNDSILRQFSQRDNEENTDVFGIIIDTYNDDQNGYGFAVHPTGVQWDGRFSSNGMEVAWDAVWISKVTIDDKNWYVEMEIPYSAIRFPKIEVQDWGINFIRKIRRHRETSFWNNVNPEINGFMLQNGDLLGLKNIEPPLRLSLTPYVSSYIENNTDNQWSKIIRGGMDLKYGFNEAFTLDMTLIPDFGQVQSDNQVLNLSPFEVQFDERRPFFTEGNELFNKAKMMFYSRRIGGSVLQVYDAEDGETVKETYSDSQILNVSKITGRTKNGLGIGIINGITNELNAKVEDANGEERYELVDPLTNYNTLILDQNLKNNSSVSFINTNVTRNGSYYDANVSALKFDLNNKKNIYNVNGFASLSQLYYSDSTNLGALYNFAAQKKAGRFKFGVESQIISDTYEPNDMGFLQNNNTARYTGVFSYNMYEPKGRLLSYEAGFETNYNRIYKPSIFTYTATTLRNKMVFRNFLTVGGKINHFSQGYDYFEPRVWGRYYVWKQSGEVKGFVSTDYRKRIAGDLWGGYGFFKGITRHSWDVTPRIRLRINDRFNIKHSVEFKYEIDNEGAAIDNDGDNTILQNTDDPTIDDIIFGRRDRRTIENILNAEYIFTNRMGISLRLRHYWSTINNKSFHILGDEGQLLDSDFTGLDSLGNSLYNKSYNAFNFNITYRWVFYPGSELTVVWKNAIYSSNDMVLSSFHDNLSNTLASPQTNSISIKLLYYLDYLSVKRSLDKRKKNK
ncbi:MAG: carbohydrate binding family 9 domain-containing protein [Flavobacteriales bacterium]|nr:carbohydrate binding family 9 domain-containing protein [Flavobacteriales bacterium]